MAALGFSYDFSHLPEFEEYSILPKGHWNVCIIDGEVKASGTTTRLQLKFRVLDGSHAGSEFTDNFTLMHDNEKAQAIGQQRLGAIQRAVNWLQALSDVAQIANKPFTVRTDLRWSLKDGKQYTFVDVKKITPYVGTNMATGADAVQPTPPAPEAPAPALGGIPAPGGLRLPAATPAMAAPRAPAVAAPVGMPADMVLPGQNTLGTQPPAMAAPQAPAVAAPVGMLPGMPAQAQAPAMGAPPAGAPMFRLPGQ